MEPTEIGKSYRRLDYETKVTGRAQYLADMSLPGMLHGKILRSPYPHARITRIDATKAEKVPGVMAVLHVRRRSSSRHVRVSAERIR